MHTVAETAAYLRRARDAGMTDAEMTAAVNQIAADPERGDVIVGSGGCRKVRVAGRGKGKSGGYRIVVLFGGQHMPIFLLWALSKGDRENFSDSEIAQMNTAAKAIIDAYRRSGSPPRHRSTS